MNISELLNEQSILILLDVSDKVECIQAMVDALDYPDVFLTK